MSDACVWKGAYWIYARDVSHFLLDLRQGVVPLDLRSELWDCDVVLWFSTGHRTARPRVHEVFPEPLRDLQEAVPRQWSTANLNSYEKGRIKLEATCHVMHFMERSVGDLACRL
jgi:hypothetical protein